MATPKIQPGTVGIAYSVFAVLPQEGLTCVGTSRALGEGEGELRHLQRIHGLLPGDLVYLGRSWWLLTAAEWVPADPHNMVDPPAYGGVSWGPALANTLLDYAARHEQYAIFRTDVPVRADGSLPWSSK